VLYSFTPFLVFGFEVRFWALSRQLSYTFSFNLYIQSSTFPSGLWRIGWGGVLSISIIFLIFRLSSRFFSIDIRDTIGRGYKEL